MQSIGPYIFSRFLGSGSFGGVWECRHATTGEKFACKIVDIQSCIDPQYFPHFENEMTIHSTIHHPCITQIKDLIVDPENAYIIQELCDGGDLNQVVQDAGGLTELQAKHYFRQIMHALSYIHSRSVAHRDIKLENVLVTSNNSAKLTDFGLCKKMEPDSPFYTTCGTLVYAAPEIIREMPYTLSADIWSAGILLYAMVADHFPWSSDPNKPQDQMIHETAQQIIDGDIELPDDISAELSNLLTNMLNLDPNERPTADQILQHPWFDCENDEILEGFSPEPDSNIVRLVDSFIKDLKKRISS